MKVLFTQSYLTLWLRGLPPTSVHGNFQARMLEWVAILFTRDLPDPCIKPGLLHCRLIWSFLIVVLEKTLETPFDSKEIKPVNPKEIIPEFSLEGLMLKLQYFGYLMQRADSFEKILMLEKIEGRRRRGWQRMGLLDSITNWMDMKSEQTPGDSEGQGSWAYCSPWDRRVSDWTITGLVQIEL